MNRCNRAKNLGTVELSIFQLHHEAKGGLSIEDVLQPDYWALHSRLLKIGNRIEVRAQDGAWWAMLIVSDPAPGLRLQVLQHVDLATSEGKLAGHDDFKAVNEFGLWTIYHTPDNSILTKGHKSLQAAHDWFANHASICSTNGKELWDTNYFDPRIG